MTIVDSDHQERLRAAFAQRHSRSYGILGACGPCPHGVSFCPCKDGGICLYTPVTGIAPTRCPRTGIVGCTECV